MKYSVWYMIAAVILVYICIVYLFGFTEFVAVALQFIRVSITVTGLLIFGFTAPNLFSEIPIPRRHYLKAAIIFFFLSLVCFSFFNEIGRIWGVDNSVFTNPIAGLFSLLAIIAAALAIRAPDTGETHIKLIAGIIGIVLGFGLVYIAPYFR